MTVQALSIDSLRREHAITELNPCEALSQWGVSIRTAIEYLRGRVVRTPLRRLLWLERLVGVPVWAKLECQQFTGSFKYRGARFRLADHDGSQVIAASAGNHGLAVATVCQEQGIPVNICIPTTASRLKRERILATGAGLIEHGTSLEHAIDHALELAEQRRWTFVSPYNDPKVIAGNATIAIEILEEAPDIQTMIVPVGGGGLVTGMAVGADYLDARVEMIGCEPARYQSLARSLEEGQITRVVHQPTLADGLAVNLEDNSITYDLAARYVDHLLALNEEELAAGTMAVLTHESLLVEPAGAAAIVACLRLAREGRLSGPVGIPLCGGNLHHTTLARVQRYPYRDDELLRLLDLRGRKVDDVPVARTYFPIEQSNGSDGNAAAETQNHIERCRRMLNETARDINDYEEYCALQDLESNKRVMDSLRAFCADIGAQLDGLSIDSDDKALVRLESDIRWALCAAAYARRSLEWCSPSYAQAGCTQFFDLGSQDNPTVNYERYESPEVQRIELQLLQVLGLDATKYSTLVTSSGVSAYTVIEAFLLRERLVAGDTVITTPYIYFEADEQIRSLPNIDLIRATSYDVDEMLDLVQSHSPRVVFVDPLTNNVQQRFFNVAEFLERLRALPGAPVTVVIDGTMTPCYANDSLLASNERVEVIYYESCSKYLQLGFDASMAGCVVCESHLYPALERLRRNTGTILYRHGALLFPVYDRSLFLQRLKRIEANARLIAQHCWNNPQVRIAADVVYPTLPEHPDRDQAASLPFAGGCVTFHLRGAGENQKDQLEALIENVLQSAKESDLILTKGVSFGFTAPRISAASAMAENDPPFLRFYAGATSLAHTERLAEVLATSIAQLAGDLA